MAGDVAALAALGQIGAGVVGVALWQAAERRQRFQEELRSSLQEVGLELVSAELGRRANNIPVWTVTVQDPSRGILPLSVAFRDDPDPSSQDTLARFWCSVSIVI